MYNAEHPTTPIADLTEDKVFDSPVSLFLRQENDLLKERIKVLREYVKEISERYSNSPWIYDEAIKVLEQTK